MTSIPRAWVAVGGCVVVAGLAALAILWLTGGIVAPADGLPDGGALVRLGLPAARVAHDLAAALTVGLLVLAATCIPPEAQTQRRALSGNALIAVRWAGAASVGWVASALTVMLLTYADVAGIDPLSAATLDQLDFFLREFESARALAISAALAALATMLCWGIRGQIAAGVTALVSLAALVPLAFAGHSGSNAAHGVAVNALVAHVIGVSVWAGGLGGLALLRRHLDASLPVVARRYSTLAGWCFVLVVVSGVAAGAARVGTLAGLNSTYGLLLAGKVAAAVLLGALGWAQRRRVLSRLDADPASGALFARLAGFEVALMTLTVGLAVALSRSAPSHLGSQEVGVPGELTPLGWLSAWRVDSLWVPVALVAIALYGVGVAKLVRRGDRWPVTRTLSWFAGWVFVVWATSGAPGVYGRVLFSMHMVQHMTLAMLAPILLVLAAPASLALRTLPFRTDGSRGPREWLLVLLHSRLLYVLTRPAVVGVLLVASLVVFYFTPLFEVALRTHAGHVVMTGHFLLVGYLFAWVICGPDPGPPRPSYPLRLVLLMATMAAHAFIAIALMSSTTILAEAWFSAVNRTWGPTLAADQNLATSLGWAMGDLPIALLSVAMAVAWIRSDEREARRYDRQADRDGDAQLVAYNAWIAGLDGMAPSATTAPPSQDAPRPGAD